MVPPAANAGAAAEPGGAPGAPPAVGGLPPAILRRVAGLRPAGSARAAAPARPARSPDHVWSDTGCMSCHEGVEQMHPWEPLSCTDCHGGNGAATDKSQAHVQPEVGWPKDERVMHRGFELAYSRFKNPSDLRVLDQTCATCHPGESRRVPRSLHGTTAGHLNDGLYENGVNPTRQAVYGIFSEKDERAVLPEHALPELQALERLRMPTEPETLGDHFIDLPGKACMQCHLWSPGVAVRGRLGQDGLYRSSGCAACHVSYAPDGLSQTRDPTVDKFEPGHPRRHEFTRAPPTDTCVSCHVGDASIGNGFRGMAQLYPDMPAGPEVPNTTDRLIAGQFFIKDPRLTPPDVHHAAGMHCIDCHTDRDVMGDGNLYGAMEHAVEIECTSCHGTFSEVSDLRTSRGRLVSNLRRNGEIVILTSKVTGRFHRVKQVKHVVDPDHPDYNAEAARAMTADHAGLECYACHSGWNTNFFGFHFDRNTQFRQLDLVSGNTTRGVVSTQERVFATLRQYVLGLNPEGRLAPYMVGFSTMGTVHGENGDVVIDQGLPETAAGLSGMTMIHHQTHTNQSTARSCVECHRSAATWGLGTGGDTGGSYALGRQLVVVSGERGIETLLFDREAPGASVYLARLPLGGAGKVLLDSDVITGRADTAFVVIQNAGVALVDVRNPAFPSVRAFVAAGDARDVLLAGDMLVIANGVHGVRLVDVADRDAPVLLSDLDTEEARGVAIDWPTLFVADGPGGLLMIDVGQPGAPQVAGHSIVSEQAEFGDDATAVDVIFQYGRPQGHEERTRARRLAVVANGFRGAAVLDVTEPLAVERLSGLAERYGGADGMLDVVLNARFELGDTSGTRPTVERDLAYLLALNAEEQAEVLVMDISDPERLRFVDRVRKLNGLGNDLAMLKSFSPPTLFTRLLLTAEDGLHGVEVTNSEEINFLFSLPAFGALRGVAVEAFAFDRMIDETGNQLKDISHDDSSYLRPSEIERVMKVPAEVLGLARDGERRRRLYAEAYASATRVGGEPARGIGHVTLSDDDLRDRLERQVGGFPMASDEPLARMVRHVSPYDHDSTRDDALARGELERMLFDLLDANDDDRLDPLEWPRHPNADPAALDRDGDGIVSRTEMALDREVFERFDLDGDGRATAESEWPFETFKAPLPGLFYLPEENLIPLMEGVGFQRRRPELYEAIAGGPTIKPRDIPPERIEALFADARDGVLVDVRGNGVLGPFLVRWDFDGDEAVDAREHKHFHKLAGRCDLNGDGKVDLHDKP